MMKLIVISHPEAILKEAEHVSRLFTAGLETFHLRKPGSNEEEFEKALRRFPPAYYERIAIHSHYKLVEKYNLKGIHLTEWFLKNVDRTELKQVIAAARKRSLSVSGSFHSIEALEKMTLKPDYVFLGPVYHSISKKGYLAKIGLEYAASFLQQRRNFEVIAIGGIDELNIFQVRRAGFEGAALLGSVWNDKDPCAKFQIIQNSITV